MPTRHKSLPLFPLLYKFIPHVNYSATFMQFLVGFISENSPYW